MKVQKVIIRGVIYVILYVVILSFLWKFLLGESVFDVIFH